VLRVCMSCAVSHVDDAARSATGVRIRAGAIAKIAPKNSARRGEGVTRPRRERGSAAENAVARRFAEICSLHNLGTLLAYARWIVEFAPMMRGRQIAKLYQKSGEAGRFMADATAALAS